MENELSLRDTQLAAVEILHSIDAICRKKGLRYWLMYGSLIGAVRHSGFIPWDDDLDIGLPRDDYDEVLRFINENPSFAPHLKVLNYKSTARSPILITRISDIRYKMNGELGADFEELGAFVDLYPFDGIGNDAEEASEMIAEDHYLAGQYVKAINPKASNQAVGSAKKAYKLFRSRYLLKKPDYYSAKLEERTARFSFYSSDYVAIRVWPDPYKHRKFYHRTWFMNCVDMPFEGMMAKVPSGYDQVLTQLYGNYMKMPPLDQRVGHHEYSLVRRETEILDLSLHRNCNAQHE